MTSSTVAQRLEALAEKASDEITRTEAFGRTWLRAPGSMDGTLCYNVVVCGAGMSGLAIAFGLKRRGVDGVLVIDRQAACSEGPWIGCARMKTLRSPKGLAGPDYGIPSLTPRAWFEAVYGCDAWDSLDKMTRQDWMAYLNWYRAFTAPRVENETELTGIAYRDGWLELELNGSGGRRIVKCRRLVLATGLDGGGGPRIPANVANLPKHFWTHSAEVADDSHLEGRSVAVLGSATSSFDWAVTALELGAKDVTMIGRATCFGRTEVLDWTNFPAYLGHFAALPDIDRWRFTRRYLSFKIPPTQDQFDRTISYPNFSIQLGHRILSITPDGEQVTITTDKQAFRADHLLLGTGYALDLAMRPELKSHASDIALWRDRFTPPAGEESGDLASHPYLGPGFELQPRTPGEKDWLTRIHMFNGAATPSMGPVSNGVTGIKFGLLRIVEAMTGSLFSETAGDFLRDLASYKAQHFDPRGYGTGDSAEEA